MRKKRAKRSPIWLMPDEEFKDLVRKSLTIGDVLSFFGYSRAGNNWKTVADRCTEQGINTLHFNGSHKKSLANTRNAIPLEEILVKNSTYGRNSLKVRLLKLKMLTNKCEICGLDGIWNDKPIKMRLDHKNGVADDNRLSNLRMVCPNCDSQLDTFSGLNKKRVIRNNCKGCGKVVSPRSTGRCRKCDSKERSTSGRLCKIVWPSSKDLLAEVANFGKSAVGKRLGVSDVAVHKRIKKIHSGIH